MELTWDEVYYDSCPVFFFFIYFTGGKKASHHQLITADENKIVWQYMLILTGENGAMKDVLLKLHLPVKQEVDNDSAS